MDDWNTIVSFWVPAYFQGRTVSFREGKSLWVSFVWKFLWKISGWVFPPTESLAMVDMKKLETMMTAWNGLHIMDKNDARSVAKKLGKFHFGRGLGWGNPPKMATAVFVLLSKQTAIWKIPL